MHAAVEGDVEVESVGELTLKGISRPVPAVNVTALRAVPAWSRNLGGTS
jgi:class 3 adenylate cyclase